MPAVDFTDEDAFALIGIMRDRVRRSGYGFLDEKSARLVGALSSVAPNGLSEKERLRIYLENVLTYFKENDLVAYRHAVQGINDQLDPESPRLLGAVVEVPDGTGIYPAGSDIPLDRLAIDRDSLAEFARALGVIRTLVLDGWMPDADGDDLAGP